MSSPFRELDRPPLHAASLRRALAAPHGPWRRIEVVAATGSTNADLAARARAGEPAGLVLAADHQSSGRGRLDRTWTAPPRSSVAVSVLLRPRAVPVGRWGWFSLVAALAMTDALVRRAGLDARLKWPNDVLVEVEGVPHKVCGVLAEAVPAPASSGGGSSGGEEPVGAVVLGAGLNVTQTEAELPVPGATSLRRAGSATTDREVLLRAYLRALADRCAALEAAAGDVRASGVAAAYRERCATIGRQVVVQLPGAEPVTGTAQEVDDDGRLVLLGADGAVRAFSAGDVVHARGA